MKKLGEFWRARVESALDERDVPYDIRDAALEARIVVTDTVATAPKGVARAGWVDPGDGLMRARTLAEFRGNRRFEPLAILFKRVDNILKAATESLPAGLDRSLLTANEEYQLVQSLERARSRTDPLWARRAYHEILPALLEMEEAIHGFFDHVLVNAEHVPTRLNRLRLLAEVRELFVRGWDLSKVVIAETAASKAGSGAMPVATKNG
jgi:glycyl-tRNA synthetase beta subunit